MKSRLLPLFLSAMAMPAAHSDQTTEKIVLISIAVEVNDQSTLLILLAADGTINRMDTGTEDGVKQPLVMGLTNKDYFAQLRSLVTPELFAYLGLLGDVTNKKGKPAKLTISFAFEDGTRNGFMFKYGTESQGPPEEVCDFVHKAVELTNPWYEEWKKKP
jgi:hypothetical protein